MKFIIIIVLYLFISIFTYFPFEMLWNKYHTGFLDRIDHDSRMFSIIMWTMFYPLCLPFLLIYGIAKWSWILTLTCLIRLKTKIFGNLDN